MNLLDLLTNPIMIIILIGVISKMVKSQKKSQQKFNRSNPKLDPMHPSHFDRKNIRTFVEKQYEQVKRNVSNNQTVLNNQSLAHPKESINMEAHKVKSVQAYQIEDESNIQYHKETKVLNPDLPKRKLHLNKENIMDSIILTEILGPPRAFKKWKQNKMQ